MKLNFIFITCITVSVLCSCSSEKETVTPEQASKYYWQAILRGDTEAANTMVIEAIDLELSQMIQPGADSDVLFFGTSVEQTGATVKTELHWVDANQQVAFQFDTNLKQIDGLWKIDADRTQQDFFKSVYDYSLTDAGIQQIPNSDPNDEDITPQELNEMLLELEQMSRELRDQQTSPDEDVEAFLELLDEDLKNKITE